MGIRFFNRNSGIILLIIAIAAGIFARVNAIGAESLWSDEILSVVYSSPDMKNILPWLLIDIHPPLFHLCMHFWMKIFGNSEIAVRIPSVIAGILTIIIAYPLTRKVFNKYIAISATIMTVLSTKAIYYSQEARSYSFLLLFSFILTAIWLDMLKELKKPEGLSKNNLIIYGVIGLITAYLHYFGTALVGFQLIYLIFAAYIAKRDIDLSIFLAFVILAIFMPWGLMHLARIIAFLGGDNNWLPKPGLSFFSGVIDFIFTQKTFLLLLLVPILLNIKGFINNLTIEIKQSGLSSPVIALSYFIFIPTILFFILSQFTPMLYDRYMMIFLPASYFLIALLLSHTPEFAETRNNIYVFAITFLAFLTFIFPNYKHLNFTTSFNIPDKQQWREASKYITDNLTDNSIILVDKPLPMYDYYFNKFNKAKKKLVIKRIFKMSDFNAINYKKYNKVFVLNYNYPLKEMENELQKSSSSYTKKDYAYLFVTEYRIK